MKEVYKRLIIKFKKMTAYFGMDQKKTDVNELFQMVSDFLKQYDARVNAYKQKQEALAKKQKKKEKMNKVFQSTVFDRSKNVNGGR